MTAKNPNFQLTQNEAETLLVVLQKSYEHNVKMASLPEGDEYRETVARQILQLKNRIELQLDRQAVRS